MRKALGVKNNDGFFNVVVQDDNEDPFIYDYDVNGPCEVVYIMRKNQWVPIDNLKITPDLLESKPEEWHREMYPELFSPIPDGKMSVELDQELIEELFDFEGIWLDYYNRLKNENQKDK